MYLQDLKAIHCLLDIPMKNVMWGQFDNVINVYFVIKK